MDLDRVGLQGTNNYQGEERWPHRARLCSPRAKLSKSLRTRLIVVDGTLAGLATFVLTTSTVDPS